MIMLWQVVPTKLDHGMLGKFEVDPRVISNAKDYI